SRGQPRLRPGDLPWLLRGVRRPVTRADPAACLAPPHRGPAAPARPAGWGRLTVPPYTNGTPGQAATLMPPRILLMPQATAYPATQAIRGDEASDRAAWFPPPDGHEVIRIGKREMP